MTRAWIFLAFALGLHVLDEAVNGFLPIWNATVTALRAKIGWLPLPTFTFDVWLTGLILGVAAMLAAVPAIRSGAPWARKAAKFLGILMIGNTLGHTAGTIFGRTVESVTFPRPMPGFWSSPILLAAATYLLVQLQSSRPPGVSGEPPPTR